jgi:hypothetical protein
MTMVDRDSKADVKASVLPKVAIVMSSIGLVVSAIALGAVAQSGLTDRDDIENRLQCLELPGPNDCGVDGK